MLLAPIRQGKTIPLREAVHLMLIRLVKKIRPPAMLHCSLILPVLITQPMVQLRFLSIVRALPTPLPDLVRLDLTQLALSTLLTDTRLCIQTLPASKIPVSVTRPFVQIPPVILTQLPDTRPFSLTLQVF